MSVAEDKDKIGRCIAVYRLHEEIGAGAMGKVYRATHETLGKEVALKLIHADDPSGEVGARFLQEGIAASKVRHPNVVEILDAGTHEGTAYMAMQLLEGETLAACLSRQGRLPPTYAIDLTLPVCAALVAAHEAGVLHRDLKPANIFLADVGRGDPEPILLDFGISKILGPIDPELTQNPRFLGSPLYIAPEQADGAPGSPLSDQYSLALSLYEALLGVRPFAKYKSSLIQLLRHVAEGDIRPPRELDASIPEELNEALCRALSTDPKARFSSMREFGAALLPFASQARSSIWQQSFVDAERTMTSANSPISDTTRSSRRIQVSVDAPPTAKTNAPDDEVEADGARQDFLTHSSLFGTDEAPSTDLDAGEEVAQSSISRRDPFSQEPSERMSGAWEEEERSTHPSPAPKSLEDDTQRDGSHPRERTAAKGVVLSLITLAILLLSVFAIRPWAAPADDTYLVALTVDPPSARISIDGDEVGTGHFSGTFPRDGRVHQARIALDGYEPQSVVFRDQPPLETITLRPLPEPPSAPALAAGATETSEPSASEPTPTPEQEPTAPPTVVVQPAERLEPRAATATQPKTSPSDPDDEAVSQEPEAEPAPEKQQPTRPSIQTGNLDPWAQ